ncbi:MAG: hypothetical protein PHC52_12930 [Syntrophales bacterium]|nr:hypothetical protein [Syntrophales bacterium]
MFATKEISHVNQVKPKIVRLVDDAPERYETDERWEDVPHAWKRFGLRFMEACAGKEFAVTHASFAGDTLWYELLLRPPLKLESPQGIPTIYQYLHVSSDYTQVIDSGYMEAK